MALEKSFTCTLPNGLHARPASAFEGVARPWTSEVILFNQRTQHAANAKSILSLVSADIRHLDPCLVTVNGPDEREAMAVLADFIDNQFPLCDQPLAPEIAARTAVRLPPCLANSQVVVYPGTAVSPGLAQGRIVRIGGFRVPLALAEAPVANPGEEWLQLRDALERLGTVYEERIRQSSGIESALLKVHRSISRDVEFRRQLEEAIVRRHRSAAGSIAEAEARFSRDLADSGSALLRDRALDIQDVCRELLQERYGAAAGEQLIDLTANSIVVAESLTPGQFLALKRAFLKGLVLAHGGSTSHTVILARSLGVPTLVGVRNLATLHAEEAILDADLGALVTQLTPAALRFYDMERNRLHQRQERLLRLARKTAGIPLKIAANISTADEAGPAFAAGAESIGLFRTEILFFERSGPPGEEEQFEAYRRALTAAAGKTVIIRTLDVGGDKPLPYLNLPPEPNPFLGYRAIRIYPEFESIFVTQIRALLRASVFGSLKIMIPMLATVDEAVWVKTIIDRELRPCAIERRPPLGAMIEVPAAAFSLDHLCRALDFFSIGSNDLLQYVMAADRGAERLGALYDPLQPAFLRLLKQIVDMARRHKREISLCGEMGGQARLLPLLAGSGLDSISAAIPAIPTLKAELAELQPEECRLLWETAAACGLQTDVVALLNQFADLHAAPLLDPELVIPSAEAATKDEAIKLAVDKLFVMGRTDDPRTVEESIWSRERGHSTGFGNGFAIPHCKTNAVRSHSLVALKFKHPVPWEAIDGQPVRVMILLAVRESDSAVNHLKTLAKLARLLMDETFRSRLEAEDGAAALSCFLREALGA
jgi:fructose-specific PTS system IIA-like component